MPTSKIQSPESNSSNPDKASAEIIKQWCSKWENRFLTETKDIPTKALFYYQIYTELGIKDTLIRKWKQLEDNRYDAIEPTLELFIRARVENAMVNPPNMISANGIAKYYGAVYFANDRKQELNISGNKDQIILNINGKDPFSDDN